MREIVLDTETTGLDPASGDRIVEIGAVELMNYLPTGRHFHQYINPGRSVPAEAVAIHGLTEERLRSEPPFAQIVGKFLDFIGDDAPLVIHNASFDMRFLNHELELVGRPTLPWSRAVDTLAMAREKLPGSASSLDALCQRFGIDNSGRELHGALLDSQLLAEVYLELVGGRQTSISFAVQTGDSDEDQQSSALAGSRRRPRPTPLPPRLSAEEKAAHEAFIAQLGDNALWRRYGSH